MPSQSESIYSKEGSRSTVTIGVTATLIKALNQNRTQIIISVDDGESNTVYIGEDNTVTISTGTPIVPGAHYIDSGEGLYKGDIYGIASGNTPARVSERVRA